MTRNLEVIDSSAIKLCLQFSFHKNPLRPAEAPLCIMLNASTWRASILSYHDTIFHSLQATHICYSAQLTLAHNFICIWLRTCFTLPATLYCLNSRKLLFYWISIFVYVFNPLFSTFIPGYTLPNKLVDIMLM